MAEVTTDPVVLGPRVVGDWPLTPIQRQIWTSQRLSPRTPLANMATAHRITGALDAARLVAAVDRVVASSDALRTVIVDRPGRTPRARVLLDPPLRTEVIELEPSQVDTWFAARIAEPVDATRSSYDSVLLRHSATEWTWWFDLHHVVTDAWSSALVFEAVSNAYLSPDPDGDLAPSTPFFTATGDERIHGGSPGSRPDPTAVPIAPYGPRGVRATQVSRHTLTETPLPDSHERYRAFGPHLTQLGLLATTTAVTLSRLDGRREISLGIPLHGRNAPQARRVIGPMMAIHPLRVDIDPTDSFASTFARISRALLALVRGAPTSDVPDSAFDAVINIQTAQYGAFAEMPTATSWMRSGHVDAAHPIRLHVYDYGDGSRLELDLNDGLSTDDSHLAFPRHLARTMSAALDDPDAVVGDYRLVTPHDDDVLARLNPPPLDQGDEHRTHLVIAELLRSDPDHVVAEHHGVELTAEVLDRRADATANWLSGLGVERGSRVGIRMHRGLDVLIAVHGVLRCGGAFVMLDPDDPEARVEAIVRDAAIAVVIDDLTATTATTFTTPFEPVEVGHDDIAYVLYTSGSTGTPKGVPVPHRGLSDYLRIAAVTYQPRSDVVMPLHSSLVFDLSITSLFLPQLVGGRTVVFDHEPVEALSRIADDPRLTVLKATPSQLELLCRVSSGPLPLEVIIVGGEAFRRPLAAAIAQRCRPGVRIFNEYGPTEAVVGCMEHEWHPGRDVGADVPIGRASPGCEVYVLDERRRHTPVGSWGELYVRRPGMATEYLGLPKTTAEHFVSVDTVGGGILYRTGDRVRVERGVLVYGGRIDDQLSVGGVRLEPGEIEAALVAHPDVTTAVVRIWPPPRRVSRRCNRCGIGDDVPAVDIDGAGICSACRAFDQIEPQTRAWFRSPADLDAALARARRRTTASYDCLHLLSGGKDSTYALYQLVERGWRVHALTLDNGYISDGAKANIARTIADLGISHEFVTTDAMNEIFRDSLDRFSNVCNGCYKTIYTLATARAHELGIPVVVTGLSRGQFFETRLLPHQFDADHFDPDEIDHTVIQARRAYHGTRDAVTELLPEQAVFERTDVDILSEIEYLDFYRYVDVELADMYDFLAERAPWVRPADTGRSTNCLINAVGIHVHRVERGYHNYAEPYSWDVRLGHKTRDEALDELDDQDDRAEIDRMLDEIGYVPTRPDVLTAWYQTVDGSALDARLLAAHLRDVLPDRAVPGAFVHVDQLPLADSTKVDVSSLPAPTSSHHRTAVYRAPTTPTEATSADIWATVLGVERVGLDDDFFDLGGASLAALEAVAATERRWDVDLPDALVFEHRLLCDFAAAVDAELGQGRSLDPVPTVDTDDPSPLSDGEEAMLFEYRAAPDDVRYNVTRVYTLDVDLDVDRLRRAIEVVVERHGPLHTSYDESRRRLAVAEALRFERLPPGPVEAVVDRQRRVPFDLDAGPLVRVHVGRPQPGLAQVVIGMHHICVDAGAFDLFWSEIDAAYHGHRLPTLETSYAAHGAWQRSRGPHEPGYWVTDDAARAGIRLPPPARVELDGYLEAPSPVSRSELASAATTTTFAASLAAAATVLSAFSRDHIVDIGITASTKDHPASEPLIGYYLNSLPMTIDVDASGSLAAVDTAAGRLVAEALPNRTYPFARMVRDARQRHERIPDISVMLAYERLAPSLFGGEIVTHRIVPSGAAVNDLTLFVQERGDRLDLGVEYRGSAVAESDAQRILDAFAGALEALCRHPHRSVGEIRGALEGDDLVGPPLHDDPTLVLQRFVEHARMHPDRPAVTDAAGRSTTYGELLDRSTGLAARLRHRDDDQRRIGVAVSRSRELIEAIIAVQISGAAYVPIDPATPPGRRTALVERAGIDTVVVDASTVDGFPGLTTIDVSAPRPTADFRSATELPTGDQPAYVIFTSGSTGEPSGIEVSHANLAASTAARPQFYGDEPPARFLLTPSIGFDSSVVGIFWPLATGGTVVVPHDSDVHDVDRLGAVIAESDVTHLLMVPSLYEALLRRRAGSLRGLHTVIVAGEACPGGLVDEHHRLLPGTELVNEYGPTEATVWATAHRCRPGDRPVPIGTPIAGSRLRVADCDQRPMAERSTGELLISGPGVVRGYLSGRSNAAFVDDGEHRWYLTGDLVQVDAEGRLVFAGRVDDQLNVGGLRLEPLEIERHLAELDGVTEAVVVGVNVADRPSIVAHLVGDPDVATHDRVRAHLAERIGAGVVPRVIAFHDALPLTPNGKLDRRGAARLPLRTSVSEPDDGPLVQIWRSALGRDDLGPDDDFFTAGGDSLAAVEVVSAVGELVGRDVAISTLLTAPTPSTMAHLLGLGPPEPSSTPAISLTTLRTGSPDGPTIVLTPAWDSVMGYRHLADAFPDDVTVLALAVESQTEDLPLTTVDALGSAAIGMVVDAVSGRSPITVVGWSIGGVVAFDLGKRLAARGVSVATIALVDTIFPGEHRHLWSNRWSKYKSMLRPGTFHLAGRELMVMVRRRVQGYAARLGRSLLAWAGQPVERRRAPVSWVPMKALDVPPAPTTLPVVLYSARTTNPRRTEHPWRTVAPGLRVVHLEGRHRGFQSIMDADRVHHIVDDLMSNVLR